MRRRRLPAEQAVWLVLGMAVMRDQPITAVARQLEIALPAADGTRTVASSALTQARTRLGAEPMEWLFLRSAEPWAHRSARADQWRGLALYGVDGTTLRVADSVENRAHFGGQKGRWDGISGYPLLRLVTVMALRSHLIAAACFGPYEHGEKSLAKPLWDSIPESSLVLMDRDYFDASINRVAAWVVGARSLLKALLVALLEPTDALRKLEADGDFTARLAMLEELKAYPVGAVWDYYCETKNVPVGRAWLSEVKSYEKDVLAKRK